MTNETYDVESRTPPEPPGVVRRVLRAVPLSSEDVREYEERFAQFEYAHDFGELELVDSVDIR
jgi:hypothetical protein